MFLIQLNKYSSVDVPPLPLTQYCRPYCSSVSLIKVNGLLPPTPTASAPGPRASSLPSREKHCAFTEATEILFLM